MFRHCSKKVNMKTTRKSPQGRSKSPATALSVLQHQTALNQGVMPAVQGEYYSYPSLFTKEQPLFALMKCKSNKVRKISEISTLGVEINAFFQCYEENPQILSIKEANALGLLGSTKIKDVFDDIRFAPTDLTDEQFLELRDSKETTVLVSACEKVSHELRNVVDLHEGLVVAFKTSGGKYGMFLVEEITFSSIQIEACHILL